MDPKRCTPLFLVLSILFCLPALAIDHPGATAPGQAAGRFSLVRDGVPAAVVADAADLPGVRIAAETLREDFARVCGAKAPETGARAIYAGTADSPLIKRLSAEGRIDLSSLKGQYETYILKVIDENTLIVAGADMRGTIYAIYSFSEQVLGVPPLWYWCSWEADQREAIDVPADFDYYQPSPTVRYRAWFPNDEDLFVPWRWKSTDNNERWLETMLRLKLNTVEYNVVCICLETEDICVELVEFFIKCFLNFLGPNFFFGHVQ